MYIKKFLCWGLKLGNVQDCSGMVIQHGKPAFGTISSHNCPPGGNNHRDSHHQRRFRMYRWNLVLEELSYMVFSITDVRGLFGHMKEYFNHIHGFRFTLINGLFDALEHFHWLEEDVDTWPTCLQELILTTQTTASN